MNNIQTKTPALFTAVVVVLVNIIFLVFFFSSQQMPVDWITIGLFSVALVIVSFLINYFLIDKFFYSNLKLIYKNILQVKNKTVVASKLKIKDTDIIPEINKQLISWETEQQNEIEELKKAEVYRREFLGNVSHELKTPIFSAQGFIHTLVDGGIEDHDINTLYLQKAGKSLDRLIAIVEDLESISKLEAGEMMIEPRTFDINDLVNEVNDSLELRAKEKNIKLTVKEIATKQIYVYADKERIRQVLINLIDNSLKYGKQDGETIINFFPDNAKVSVEVSDNGIGIEKAYLPRLFERFFRVDKSRSRDIGGTGLGLAIVKHIIEAHQQTIAVESIPGQGTTFSFSLKKSK